MLQRSPESTKLLKPLDSTDAKKILEELEKYPFYKPFILSWRRVVGENPIEFQHAGEKCDSTSKWTNNFHEFAFVASISNCSKVTLWIICPICNNHEKIHNNIPVWARLSLQEKVYSGAYKEKVRVNLSPRSQGSWYDWQEDAMKMGIIVSFEGTKNTRTVYSVFSRFHQDLLNFLNAVAASIKESGLDQNNLPCFCLSDQSYQNL